MPKKFRMNFSALCCIAVGANFLLWSTATAALVSLYPGKTRRPLTLHENQVFDGTKLPVVVMPSEYTTYGMRSPFLHDLSTSVPSLSFFVTRKTPSFWRQCADSQRAGSATKDRGGGSQAKIAGSRATPALILSDWSVIPSLPEKLKARCRFLSFFHSPAGAMLTLLEQNSIESLGPGRHPHKLNSSDPKGAVQGVIANNAA
jgi:hypothetical protein